MVTGEEYSSDGIRTYAPFGHTWAAAIRIVAGKTFVYCGLYAIFSFFLLGLLPYFFSIPNIGNGLYIVLLMIPYLIATSFLGLAASRYFTDSEAPLLMIAFFSVGLIFLSGVSYPMELMPWYWKATHYILPASEGQSAVPCTLAPATRPDTAPVWSDTSVIPPHFIQKRFLTEPDFFFTSM